MSLDPFRPPKTLVPELPECVTANRYKLGTGVGEEDPVLYYVKQWGVIYRFLRLGEVRNVSIFKETAPLLKEALLLFETPGFVNTNATQRNASDDQIPQRQQLEHSNVAIRGRASQLISQACSYI